MAAVEEKLKIKIRPLIEIADLHEAVRVQKLVWKFNDIDLLPPRLFVVATKIGGQAFGAFDGSRMAGFCLAIPGLKAGGEYYLHSHMLGVLPEYENRRSGRSLKLAQREDGMTGGIRTFSATNRRPRPATCSSAGTS